MRNTAARVCRKAAAQTGLHRRLLKRFWKGLPQRNRTVHFKIAVQQYVNSNSTDSGPSTEDP